MAIEVGPHIGTWEILSKRNDACGHLCQKIQVLELVAGEENGNK